MPFRLMQQTDSQQAISKLLSPPVISIPFRRGGSFSDHVRRSAQLQDKCNVFLSIRAPPESRSASSPSSGICKSVIGFQTTSYDELRCQHNYANLEERGNAARTKKRMLGRWRGGWDTACRVRDKRHFGQPRL